MMNEADLDTLDRFLMSDHAPDDSMGLSDLDGFLTGILIGPELVLPGEWLPHVWGGEAPTFESDDEAQVVHSALLGHYNAIARALDSGEPDQLAPVYWVIGEEDTVRAGDWAEGFLDAMRLRPDAWAPLARDKHAGLLLVPILALCGNEASEELLPLDAEARAEMLTAAPDLIPTCVVGIRDYWLGDDSRSHLVRTADKPGRNSACPCGSGREYKRCCGAN